jgi:hypothetical protein
MPVKISEKKLFISLFLFIAAVVVVFNVKLFNGRILIYEKGLLLLFISIVLFITSIYLFIRTITK